MTTAHLAACLEDSAVRNPERTAVVQPDGRSIDYGSLAASARRVAGLLRAHGVETGDRVGVLAAKSIETIAAVFGILEVGAVVVPADASAPVERCRTIFADCRVRALFVDPGRQVVLDGWPQDALPDLVVSTGAEAGTTVRPWSVVDAADPLPADAPRPGSEDLAYMLYTSGSTGVPKGVMLSHGNMTSFVDWCSETLAPRADDRFSSHAPLHFDLSVHDLYVSLKHGAELHLIADDVGKDPRQLAKFAGERGITVWYSTPSVLTLLAQFGRLDRLDYAGPRIVLFAGEVFPARHLRATTQLWSQAAYYNLYGPTETNVCTYTQIPLPVPEDRADPYPIGRVCSHCRGLVLDEDGNEVEPGGEGVLYVAGAPVFQGYWNRPEQNARAFREVAGERWYSTGDLVREDPDGDLVYVGRVDRMVKRRGYRVELGEVESAFYGHGALREVAAVALDEPAGLKIVACLVAEGERPSIIELKGFGSRRLPGYMVPDAFRFLDALPRTSTDKVDYQGLLRVLREE